MSIQNVLNTAICGRLSGGTALTALLGGTAIYFMRAPDDAELDYVVWQYQGGGDENLTPNRTKNEMVTVKSYSGTGPAKAGQIDAAVDALLHGKALTVTGWTNFWLMREQDGSSVEIDVAGAKTYLSFGIYRVRLDQN